MQSLNCKSLKMTFLCTITHFIPMRIFIATKFCINCSGQFVKSVFNGCEKCWYWIKKVQWLECKIFRYKPLKMDPDCTGNIDFKIQKMQVSHCNNCKF